MSYHKAICRLRPRLQFIRLQSTSSGPQSTRRFSRLVSASVGVASFGLGWYAYGLTHKQNKTATKVPDAATAAIGAGVELPLINAKNGYPFNFLKPPSPEQVTEILNRDAWSVSTPSTALGGVSRYYGSQVPSNGPCEDRYIHGKFPSPSQPSGDNNWLAWGIFDGHLGSQVSQALTQHLLPYVHKSLARAFSQGTPVDDAAIHNAITAAFLSLDDAFLQHAEDTIASPTLTFAQKIARLSTGSNGSCALLSLYDPSTHKLHVACTGDSRAVLGRLDPTTNTWTTVPLSEDQGGGNPAEGARVAAEHPGEDLDALVKNGRVLGLATARAFGDGHWKWSATVQADGKERYLADTLRPHSAELYKTPPYVTAKPEVTTTVVEKGQPAFMILGSDGLWDVLTSEQAVGLVGRWIEWRKKGGKPDELPPQGKWEGFDLAVYRKEGWNLKSEKETVQDENAAVHLVRNALGGAHHDMVSGLLSLKPPYSRWCRDDITVQVVFFNC
ncbi:phosphatase 2C-like domain-containing protein [Lasiosphaeria hispida]|uniref:Phosphatase 2C-like domain-containing protein n=1 Tax=Lasiosphaeria hispida TaxID=260671 RepID=A0AAJ0MEJ6_9PEZI|nr:phosphatase 2C-like domain-containing protein [Lasiosphaeria hispida]